MLLPTAVARRLHAAMTGWARGSDRCPGCCGAQIWNKVKALLPSEGEGLSREQFGAALRMVALFQQQGLSAAPAPDALAAAASPRGWRVFVPAPLQPPMLAPDARRAPLPAVPPSVLAGSQSHCNASQPRTGCHVAIRGCELYMRRTRSRRPPPRAADACSCRRPCSRRAWRRTPGARLPICLKPLLLHLDVP